MARRSKLTDEAMVECVRLGVPVDEIATAAGLSLTWTYRRLKRAGADVGQPPRRPCPIPIEQLADEYAAGAGIKILADRHGLYFRRVRELLLQHGVELRVSSRTPGYFRRPCPVPLEQLAAEYAAGASIKTLASRHGLYVKLVRELLVEQGVEVRARGQRYRPPA